VGAVGQQVSLTLLPITFQQIVVMFCTSRGLADIIYCAKFHIDWSRGYGVAGVQKWHVPIGKRSRPYTALHYHACCDHVGFRSNGPDTDRSVSRFTSVGHGPTDSCQTGSLTAGGLRMGPTAVRRTVSDRCEPRNGSIFGCPSPVRGQSVSCSRRVRGLSVSGPLDLNQA
jgi:hypothetical protein